MGTEVTGPAIIDRRALLAGGAAAALVLALGLPGRAHAAAPELLRQQVELVEGRPVTLWYPDDPAGVALFSHGHGSWPDRYERLAQLLGSFGFATFAPMHVDSVHFAGRDKVGQQQMVGERLRDMAGAAGYCAKAFAGKPTIAVGHSFGTLTALSLVGGLPYLGTVPDLGLRGVLGFSTPGKVPGLVQPTAYATVRAPVMIVTGTADRVPGFVTDPADHLCAAETSAADHYALVVDGADHLLVASDALARAAEPARLFVTGYGLGEAPARAALARWHASAGDRFIAARGKA